MSSLIVSTAVARVKMIVQSDAAMPFGQLGATSGEVVAPSSEIVATAEAGTRAHSATAPARANRERFISRLNTTPKRQLRQAPTPPVAWRGPQTCATPSGAVRR